MSSFYVGMMGHLARGFWPGVWDVGILRAAVGRGISGIGYGFPVDWRMVGLGFGLSFYGARTVS